MKPMVPEVAPLVRRLYGRHGAGCCWHVVLDDGNCEASSVARCVAYIETHGCPYEAFECLELARLLPLMSRTQLRKLRAAI